MNIFRCRDHGCRPFGFSYCGAPCHDDSTSVRVERDAVGRLICPRCMSMAVGTGIAPCNAMLVKFQCGSSYAIRYGDGLAGIIMAVAEAEISATCLATAEVMRFNEDVI